MPGRLKTACWVLLVAMLALLFASCSTAVAQAVVPVIPTGLPWDAIAIGAMAVMQGTQIFIAVSGRTTTGAKQSETDLRAETKALATQLQASTEKLATDLQAKTAATDTLLANEIKDIHRCVSTISDNVRTIASGFTGAVNEDRVRAFEHMAACAREHGNPAPERPVLMAAPQLKRGELT